MKVKILGCGPSFGVPSIDRGFGCCDPKNPKNSRLRSSIIVEEGGTSLLIDSGPDIRMQLLKQGAPHLDAVLYSHDHYDHMGGADDLRGYLNQENKRLPVFMTEHDSKRFKDLLKYMYTNDKNTKKSFEINIIKPYIKFNVKNMQILPILQKHGEGYSLGFRMNDFAYSTDVSDMESEGFEALKGIRVWVLDVITPFSDTKKHLNIEKALQWIQKVKPEKVYLTHMGTHMDYDTLCKELPDNIEPLFDGMEFDL